MAYKKTERYYPKYSLESGELILDTSKASFDGSEMLILPYKITKTQGYQLKGKVERSHYHVERMPFLHEYQFQFYKIFHVCEKCNFVSEKRKVNKAWGPLCRRCFRKRQAQDVKQRGRDNDYRKKIIKYRAYLKTTQGKINAVPKEYLISNMKIELDMKGLSLTQLAEYMGVSSKKLYNLLSNRFIKEEIVLAASSLLNIPINRFLKIRRGLTNPTIDGIPAFWLKDGFLPRINKKSDSPE